MTTSNLIRWNGLLAMVNGAVIILFNLAGPLNLVPAGLQNPRTFVTTFLLVLVFMGFYAQQHERAGRLGLIGLIVTELGLILNLCFRFADIAIAPVLLTQFAAAAQVVGQGPYASWMSATFIIFTLGYVLFGIATLRAGVFPRWTGWLLIVGALLSYAGVFLMLPLNIGALLANTAIVGMGWIQWARRNVMQAQTQQPSSAATS